MQPSELCMLLPFSTDVGLTTIKSLVNFFKFFVFLSIFGQNSITIVGSPKSVVYLSNCFLFKMQITVALHHCRPHGSTSCALLCLILVHLWFVENHHLLYDEESLKAGHEIILIQIYVVPFKQEWMTDWVSPCWHRREDVKQSLETAIQVKVLKLKLKCF